MQRSLSAVSRLAPLARSAVPLGSRAPVLRAPVRAMSGGDGEHHSHDMFDMSTPYNPMGAPLAIFLTVVVGGLGTIWYAFSHTQWKFRGKKD